MYMHTNETQREEGKQIYTDRSQLDRLHVCVIVCVCDCVCVCVCSCVCERENDREREKTRERKKESDREYVFAGMHICMCLDACNASM